MTLSRFKVVQVHLERLLFVAIDVVELVLRYGLAYVVSLELLSVAFPESQWTERWIRLLAMELSRWLALGTLFEAYFVCSLLIGTGIYITFEFFYSLSNRPRLSSPPSVMRTLSLLLHPRFIFKRLFIQPNRSYARSSSKLRTVWDASYQELALCFVALLNHVTFVYPPNAKNLRHDVAMLLALEALETYVRAFFWTMLVLAALTPFGWCLLPRRPSWLMDEDDSISRLPV